RDGRYISAVELTHGPEDGHTVPGTHDDEAGPDPEREHQAQIEEDAAFVHDVGAEGATGGVICGVVGALGGTAVSLAIPGVGLALGSGLVGVAAGSAVAGAGVGAFAGALSHTPASRSWERALVEFGHGELAVGLHTDESETFEQGLEIMQKANPPRLRRVGNDGELL